MTFLLFEGYPPNGQAEARHIVRASIQIESDNVISIVFSGRTYPFRKRFEDAGVGGAALGEEGMVNRPYIRVIETLDVSVSTNREMVKGIFGKEVLKSAATQVMVEDEVPGDETAVAHFIQELRNLTSLHFV